jgi:peptide/nickel transport system permease protein
MTQMAIDSRAAAGTRFWSRAIRHRSFMIGAVLIGIMVAAALLSLFWTPYSPTRLVIADRYQAPSLSHWMGTDRFGRDILSMIMAGAQTSIVVGLIAVSIGVVFGVALGLLAAARRGWIEDLVMRLNDLTYAFPVILVAILITAGWGPGITNAIIALGIVNIPIFARLVRGAAQAVWAREYVLAARAAGKGQLRITIEHVLPNVTSVIIVQATISFAIAILAEAALSYLGVGSQPPDPSWGRMLDEMKDLIFANPNVANPLMAIWPGMAIAMSVLGLNLMGDGLRDLLDPRLARLR